MIIEILTELNKMNRELVLTHPDKKSFRVQPEISDEDLNKKIASGSSQIHLMLVNSDALVTEIETWAGEDSLKWQKLFTAFRKDYKAQWHTWDAYDHLISWIRASRSLLSARKNIHTLKAKKEMSRSDGVSFRASHSDITAYLPISERQRTGLVNGLLSHDNLYGRLQKYMENRDAEKETVSSSSFQENGL